jgi:Calx-beta domain-containing protein/VCBS repeat protein
MKRPHKRLLLSLLFTFAYALALVPASYAVDGCSSPGFKVAPTINLEAGQFGMAVADFNGDGHLDLAVSPNNGFTDLMVLLGRGGTERFGPPTTYPAGGPPRRIAVGDFNGDGKPDLAVSLDGSGQTGFLAILLNDGTGKFGAPNLISLQGIPGRPAVDDVNNDGKLDIVTALSTGTTDGKVDVLLGNGTGSFSHAANAPFFTLRVNAFALVLGDFNEDGKRDLAVPNSAGGADIMLGDGTGVFAPLAPSQISGGSLSMTPGDFNEDGHLDLLIDNRMFLGTGTANFSAPTVVDIPSDSSVGFAVDVNQDGHLDAVEGGPRGLTIMLGNGTGSLARGKSYTSGITLFGATAAFAVPGDFNEDGKLDLAAVQTFGIGILNGDGTGEFYDALSYQSGLVSPQYLAAADFNNDGKQDFVTVAGNSFPSDFRIEVALGDGNGGFTRKSLSSFGISQPRMVAAADFNNDGKPDLAVTVPSDGRVYVLLNDGTGGFPANGTTQSYIVGGQPSVVKTGDFNNDTKVDLVVLRSNSNGVYLLYGDGAGFFSVQTFTPLPSTTAFGDVAVGDFNADGKADLAVSAGTNFTSGTANFVRVLTGNGAGIFPSFTDIVTTGAAGWLVIRDLNGDSKPDIAVSNTVFSPTTSNYVTIILNNAPSGFLSPTDYPTDGAGNLGVGDFNNDGKPDLVLSSGAITIGSSIDGIALLTNKGNGDFNASVNISAGSTSSHLAVSDFNNDGKDDVMFSQYGTRSTALLLNDVTVPQPCLSVNDAAVTEPDSGTVDAVFTVTLSAPSAQTVRVNYFVLPAYRNILDPSGNPIVVSSTKGVDFENVAGTLTFLPGETTQNLIVPVKGDLTDEFDELFRVILTTPVNAYINDGKGTGTILDNDAPPTISINDVAGAEGTQAQSSPTFTVTLSAPSEKPISVQYATAPGTASANVDYATTSGTLDFAVGQVSRTIPVTVIQDNIFEPDETFFVNLSNPTNVTIADDQGQGTITNDDPQPTITIGSSSRIEGASGTSGNSTFNVNLSNPSYQTITVSFATADQTATAGSDYVGTSGTLTFNPGETAKTINVQVLGDDVDEVIEAYLVNLTNPTNATIATAQGTGQIIDDDGPTISIGNASVIEGNSGFTNAVFTVTLSAPSVQTITVNYATVGGTATSNIDFVRVVSNTLFFPVGATSATFNVRVFGDFEIEPDEQFTVNLQSPSNATIAPGQGTGTGTILNDDSNGKLRFGSSTYTVSEDGGSAVIAVSRVEGATGTVTVDYATSNGTATAGSDYTATSGTLAFVQGETAKTFSVPIANDGVFEVPETLNLTLNNPTGNAVLTTPSTAVLTINTPPLFLLLEDPPAVPGQVAALDSVSSLRDPFSILSMIGLYPAADRNSRVTLFVTNLQLAPTDVASSVKVRLTDSNNQNYEVGAEDVRVVPGTGFTQITFRLPDNLSVGTVNIKIVAHDQESNQGTFRISN